MRALLALGIFASSFSVSAAITPEDVFGAVFGIIANQINNSNGNNGHGGGNNNGGNHNGNWGPNDNNLILKDMGKSILFGTSTLDEDISMGTLDLPRCGASGNQRVSKVRFMVNGDDVYINRIQVTYQNGVTERFSVNQDFSDGDRSDTFALKGNNDRCIKRIRVSGQVYEGNNGGGWHGNNGGWNNNNNWPAPNGSVSINFGGNGGWNGNGKPGKPNKPNKWKTRAIVSLVGIK